MKTPEDLFEEWYDKYFGEAQGEDSPYSYNDVKIAFLKGLKISKVQHEKSLKESIDIQNVIILNLEEKNTELKKELKKRPTTKEFKKKARKIYGDLVEENIKLKNEVEVRKQAHEEDVKELKKELDNILWKCPICKKPMKHLREIHTFECKKCDIREWYPQRQSDFESFKKIQEESQEYKEANKHLKQCWKERTAEWKKIEDELKKELGQAEFVVLKKNKRKKNISIDKNSLVGLYKESIEDIKELKLELKHKEILVKQYKAQLKEMMG